MLSQTVCAEKLKLCLNTPWKRRVSLMVLVSELQLLPEICCGRKENRVFKFLTAVV